VVSKPAPFTGEGKNERARGECNSKETRLRKSHGKRKTAAFEHIDADSGGIGKWGNFGAM